jgi:hypothetical protein
MILELLRVHMGQDGREGRLEEVTDTAERVLGRKPITFDQWVLENIEAFRTASTPEFPAA